MQKYHIFQVEEEFIEKMPLSYNHENRAKILKEFINEPYGWAGLLNDRCSSFTQDYFSVFGKYLHRNSKAQTTNGKYFDISQLNLDEKKRVYKKKWYSFFYFSIFKRTHNVVYRS